MVWLIDRLIEMQHFRWYYDHWREAGDLVSTVAASWPDYAPRLGPNVVAFPSRDQGPREFLRRWITGKVEGDIERMLDVAAGLSIALHAYTMLELIESSGQAVDASVD